MSAGPLRIVVADDHPVIRSAFAALLDSQPDFTVVRTAADGTEAVRACREERPDLVLMDIRMPGTDGIEATRQLTADGPNPPRVLILTTFDLDEYVYEALRAGASGFLLKEVTAERLFEAVRVVAAGDALLAPGVTRRLIAEFAAMPPRDAPAPGAGSAAAPAPEPEPHPAAERLRTLTPRETEVLRLVAEGLSNPELAARLTVTEETVKTHVSRILAKLGLRDRTQAVVTAYETGLVVPGRGR
ncbi:response regulator transcription factor [Kitasatospora sp. NA04385]|uniref:response regulator transcription factor n=1 Tax=Kitasatospora sp. NA04385 TaxID=2742135 RepID=UPI001591ED8F|nr:response regulator transcription factor [Kitasatospora sp. NA04385]QKW22447.1 response regulator transcription factor [Kitasatospora sp. NA04385]